MITWDKPGPGSWTLDSGHFDGNSSKICQDLIIEGMAEGTEQGFAMIGAPLHQMQAAFVNGRFYHRMVPLIGDSRDLPTPPAPLLWLATRLHPVFRRAERTAQRALDGRIWMTELERWENDWKPQLIADSRRFSAVDVATRTDAELAQHLLEVNEHARFGTTLHFRLHISDLGPIGLLLVRAREWDLDQTEVMAALAGHSPATNAPADALARIRQLVAGHDPAPRTLDDIRAHSSEAAALLDAFLDEYGWRMTTGYDIRGRFLREMPDAVLASVASPLVEGVESPCSETTVLDRAVASGAAALAVILDKVDPSDRDELDRLVADARALYGLRDENGPLTYQWPAGLLRRAVIEASRRLSDQLPSSDSSPSDAIFDLSAAEIAALLNGERTLSRSEIEARVNRRLAALHVDAPSFLGRQEDDPPLWAMPTALGRLLDVIFTVLALIESESSESGALTGVGIGDETYTGRARVVSQADEALTRLEPGDVLVAAYTVPTYNSVLAIAGAVVVDSGGLLCHAAVIAREFGIPAVVGVGTGTSSIPDGAMIEVDPLAGTVRVIDQV